MEGQSQALCEEEVVVTLDEILPLARSEVHPPPTDAPHILGVEDQSSLKADAATVEMVPVT